MPNETSQPLRPDQPRSADDRELVEGVLGTRAADEMQELTGGQLAAKDQPEATELDLSADEQAATTEAEDFAEIRRQEYCTWAKELGKDEEWVNDMFIFEDGGRVRLEQELNLSRTGFKEFPPGLYCDNVIIRLAENGLERIGRIPEGVVQLDLHSNYITKIENIPSSVKKLYLHNNHITCVENIPDGVTDLSIDNNRIKSIKSIPDNMGYLDLSDSLIDDLSPLVGKTIKNLHLVGISAESIPEGILAEMVKLDSKQEKLLNDALEKGYTVEF